MRRSEVRLEDMSSEARHEAEEATVDSSQVLLEGLEAGEVGVWSWNSTTGALYWSPNLEKIHRLPAGGFDGTFSAFADDIHPDDREHVLATVERSIAEGGSYKVQYRLPPRDGEDERWLEARGKVQHRDGQVVGMSGICLNITDQRQSEADLEARARQQESVARLGQLALMASGERELFDVLCKEVAEVLDVEFTKILELSSGGDELILRFGAGWQEGLVGNTRLGVEVGSQAGYSLRANTPIIVDDLSSETRFEKPDLLRSHSVISGLSVVIPGAGERPYGVLGAHSSRRRRFRRRDADYLQAVANTAAAAIERYRARERQDLLIRELRHRVGNLLSQIVSLFNNSASGAANVGELEEKFLARVVSLSRAHSLISEGGWRTASLNRLIHEVLEPYLDRVTIEGRAVALSADAAFALSLALHEMATNATKYGALSSASGRLSVTWSVTSRERQSVLLIDWAESGGPAVQTPSRRGFGTKLVTGVVERQLDGKIEADFAETGFKARLEIPLT